MSALRLEWGEPLLDPVVFVVCFVHSDSLVVAIRYVPSININGAKGLYIRYSSHDVLCGCFVSLWTWFRDNSGEAGLRAFLYRTQERRGTVIQPVPSVTRYGMILSKSLGPQAFFWPGIGISKGLSLQFTYHASLAGVKRNKNQKDEKDENQ